MPITQMLRVMKLTAFLLTVLSLHVMARTEAQTISYEGKNVSLKSVFAEIKKQTHFYVVYNTAEVNTSAKVSVQAKDEPLVKFLTRFLGEQGLKFRMEDNTIVISPKEKTAALITQGLNPGLTLLPATIDVHGIVKDESGKPAAGVAVQVKGTNKGTTTNANGEFTLVGVTDQAVLIFSSVNLQSFEIKVSPGNAGDLAITLKAKVSELADVTITAVNTGYQLIPKERATGSFVLVDSALLNRSVSTSIIDRLENITSGLAFNKNLSSINGVPQANASTLTIRGRGTINSNPNPLIVVDNFPYDGDINTINPDDVESVTILKDAAAAAIWGAFSGNGVIVITTKKGKYNQSLRVNVNSFLTVGDKPNLKYAPFMSSGDYIDVESFLYSKGFYTSRLSATYNLVSPAVEIFAKRAAGQISATDSAGLINQFKSIDFRDDVGKYFYQKNINQHYDVGFTGGGLNNKYYFSAGFDNNRSSLVGNAYQRATVRASNTYSLLNHHLDLTAGIQFQQSLNFNNAVSFTLNYPYQALKDANGNELIVPNTFRQGYKDTAGQGKMLNWNYNPFDELRNSDNSTRLTDYHIDLSAKYKIINGLSAEFYYNYNTGTTDGRNFYNQQTYFTRNLINSYTQINFVSGAVTRPVPLGGILNRSNSKYESSNFRGLLNYTHVFAGFHTITAMAGTEIRRVNGFSYTNRLYGYNADNTTFMNVDYTGQYPNYVTKGNTQIPNNITNSGTENNFISYYALAGYSYKNKYAITLSGRRDESNLLGVNANLKGVPLYSAGLSWEISKETFYVIKWLPYLKFRVTDGYQGNSNTNVAALTTISYALANSYGATQAGVSNIPNPELRWEKINHINIGVDFATKNNLFSGSIEYFVKNGADLIAATPIDPTTGTSSFSGNTANMRAHGLDVLLTSKNIVSKNFQWTSTLLFSYSIDKITDYLKAPGSIGDYLTSSAFLSPLIGRPLYSIYAYQWAGLDAAGNPQAYLDGKINKTYGSFASSTNFDNLKYIGPANPPIFGSLLNKIDYHQFSLSCLVTYKFGAFFRRSSITYTSLFSTFGGVGNPEYAARWQKAGDENLTNVPSMIYPANSSRDAVYNYADINTAKGDFIRLQDIQLSYSVTQKLLNKIKIQSASLFINANNLGILWRANTYGLDPDVVPSNNGSYALTPNPKSYSIGLRIGL